MAKEKNLYGNWSVLAPDGELLSYGSKKRAMWYVNKGIADIVDTRTIKLKFEPKGRNTDEYTLKRKENKCVVCGSTIIKDLTKHHVVPSMYKKLFPVEYKARSSHDVVVICKKHHSEYEHTFADQLKQELAEKYNAPLQITPRENDIIKSIMICRTIIKYWDQLPGDRLETLLEEFKEINGYEPLSFDEMDKFIEDNEDFMFVGNTHSQIVVDAIQDDLSDFIVMWRKHFIDSMNPQFMPEKWDVYYRDFIK
jgi:hypothetical protein